MQKKNSLIIIDGSYYLYRAYYAFPFLINSRGEHTGAIYGFINMLKSFIMQYKPNNLVIVFDTKGKTFRNKIYKYYKNKRNKMSDNLIFQIDPLLKIVKAMGILYISIYGIEADDIIGTLAIESVAYGYNVLISTCDKDMAQLVSKNISILNNNSIFGPEEINLKFGIPPNLIVDYLSLMGDSIDNIPGVPGIGKKTAKKLLNNLGDIKYIYKNLYKISTLNLRGYKNIINNLEKYIEIAFISYKLATIKKDVPLNLYYNKLRLEEPNIELLKKLFKRFELKSFLIDLEKNKFFIKKNNYI